MGLNLQFAFMPNFCFRKNVCIHYKDRVQKTSIRSPMDAKYDK